MKKETYYKFDISSISSGQGLAVSHWTVLADAYLCSSMVFKCGSRDETSG